MAATNQKVERITIHEGGTAKQVSSEMQLRRSVMCCMLWEDEFYEDGLTIANRIASLIPLVDPFIVSSIAIEAREKMKLRHVSLLIVREMARHKTHKGLVSETLEKVIQRPDELSEFISLYWKDKKEPLSAQVKKGLAAAFTKFNAYSLAKYNRNDRKVKLRDVLFLCHAKPKDAEQEALWKQLIDNTLPIPDTWEVELSASKDKKASWARLLSEKKLGALALLRNLRNMTEAGVAMESIKEALAEMKTERVLPFRFISAARVVSHLESALERSMFKCIQDVPKLEGTTCVLVDVSGSMNTSISAKSDLARIDAACAVAILIRELCVNSMIFSFSEQLQLIPDRRGFALRDAILTSQPHTGTELRTALRALQQKFAKCFDRLIVITDEQASSSIPDPIWKRNYMINIASAKNGVGYGKWAHIDGWSEAVIDYIREFENGAG